MSENDEIDEEKIIETVKLLVETLKFKEFIFFSTGQFDLG